EGAAADWELNSASWARKGILDGPAKIAFEQDEGAWLNSLPVLCGLPPHLTSAVSQTQRRCVITEYRKRAKEYREQLAGDALMESKLSVDEHTTVQRFLSMNGFL